MNDFSDDPTDLAVWPTASGAIGFGVKMIRFAAVAGVINATLVAGLMVLGLIDMPTVSNDGGARAIETMGNVSGAADVILLVSSFALTAAFTVFFHRRVMVGHVAPVRLQFGRREARFLFATIAYSLTVAAPAVAVIYLVRSFGLGDGVPFMTFLLVMAIVAGVLFLLVRFALAFPAIAVDAPGSLLDQFKYAYTATAGRFGRLLSIYVVAYLVFLLVIAAFSLVLGMVVAGFSAAGMSSAAVVWLAVLVQTTLQFTALAVFASIASQAFIAWSGWSPEQGLQAPSNAPLV